MATLILKSLLTGYGLVALFFLIFLGGQIAVNNGYIFLFVFPILFWPATLIVSGLALLVFKAIEEYKQKGSHNL